MYTGIIASVVRAQQGPCRRPTVQLVGIVPVRLVVRLHRCPGLTAYSFGLPDRPQAGVGPGWAAGRRDRGGGAHCLCCPVLRRRRLLPRFVVLGAGVVLAPWYVLCAAATSDTRNRLGERDRVVVVATSEEMEGLREELEASPERSALIVGSISAEAALSTSIPPDRPLIEVAEQERATVVVLSRHAQGYDDVVVQAAKLHQRRCPGADAVDVLRTVAREASDWRVGTCDPVV